MEKNEASQLYSLLIPLSKCHDDKDDLGAIIGYGTFEGLSNFKSKSKSSEERKFGEIKSVYNEFKKILENSREGKGYELLYEIQLNVEEKLKKIKKNPHKKLQSPVLERMMDYFKRKEGNYEDKLRRMGFVLMDTIQENGEIKGTDKKKMNIDYESIKYAFTRKKGDRR